MKKLTINDAQIIAKHFGGKCMSESYINDNTKMLWECSEKHEFWAVLNSVRANHWCPYCKNKKVNIQNCIDFAISKNGKCLTENYNNSKEKLKWQCKNGHVWESKFSETKKIWCKICSKKYKQNTYLENTNDHLISLGAKLITKKYKTTKSKLTIMCKNGHTVKVSPESIKYRGFKCKKCSFSLDTVKNLAIKKGGKCLNKKLLKSNQKFTFECANGHTWKTLIGNAKKHWCLVCSGIDKKTIEHAKKLAKSKGGLCLTSVYKNARTVLSWQCSSGHVWMATYDSVKRSTWCPYCKNKTEQFCRQAFEELTGFKFVKKRFAWLKNPKTNYQLELDGYCSELNLAFEYNGEQHYQYVSRYKNNKEMLKDQKYRDSIKRKLCKKHKLELIIIKNIPCNKDNIYKRIKFILKRRKIIK